MRILMGLALWGMAEIAAFVVVGAWIGVMGVMAVVLGTGFIGVALLRRQGMQALGLMRGRVVRPASLGSLGSSGLMMLGCMLLVLPGLLSDLAGATLLVPAVRRGLVIWLAARFKPVAQDDILDGVAVEVEAPRLPSGWTRP